MEYRSFLIKYAEIGVKGRNRNLFEDALVRQIRNALKRCEGEFAVRRTRGRVYVEVLSESYDYEETVEGLKTVFGIGRTRALTGCAKRWSPIWEKPIRTGSSPSR